MCILIRYPWIMPWPDFSKNLVKRLDVELVSFNWCMQMSKSKSVTNSSFILILWHRRTHSKSSRQKKISQYISF